MRLPLQVTFHNLPSSEAMKATIQEYVGKLEKFYPRIIGCRVAVEAGRRQSRKLHRVKIELSVPGAELVAGEETATFRNSQQNAYLALRESFHEVRRRLQEYARKQRGEVKHHPSDTTPFNDAGSPRSPARTVEESELHASPQEGSARTS